MTPAVMILAALLGSNHAFADHRMGSVLVSTQPLIGPASEAPPSYGDTWEFVYTPPDPNGVTQYLILHFTGPVDGGDRLEVDLGYDQDLFYSTAGDSFWTRPIGGNSVTIRYVDLNSDGGGGVTLDKYGRGEEIDVFMLSRATTEPNCCNPSGLCPATGFSCPQAVTPSWENVNCTGKWVIAQSVGMIIGEHPCVTLSGPNPLCTDSPSQCTSPYCIDNAWKSYCPDPGCADEAGCPEVCLGSPVCDGLQGCTCLSSCSAALIDTDPDPDSVVLGVLTAGHCFLTDADIASASFTVDFEATCDGSAPLGYDPKFFKLTRVVKARHGCIPDLDYAIIELDATEAEIGAPPLPIRHTTGDPDDPADDLAIGDDLFVIHHPRGAAKKLSAQLYEDSPIEADGDRDCEVNGLTSTKVQMGCDFDNGSSGSPLFDLDGSIVGVNVTSGGCSNSSTSGAAILDDWLCSSERPLNYDVVTFPLPSDPPDFPPEGPLLPGYPLELTVRYQLTDNPDDGPQCVDETYYHRVYLADPTPDANPVGDDQYSWSDDEPLCLGAIKEHQVVDWSLPCPTEIHDTYQLCAELNSADLPTEEDFSDNLECVDIGPICYPNLDVTITGFFETDCAACEPDGGCEVGDATSLCDFEGCTLDRCVLAAVTVCNTGCWGAEDYDIHLDLNAYGEGFMGFCADIDNPVSEQDLLGEPGLSPGSPEAPECADHLVPFRVPLLDEDADGAPIEVISLIVDVIVDAGNVSLPDCYQLNNGDSIGLPWSDCIDPECPFGLCDDCLLCPLTCVAGVCPPDDDDDDDDRFGAGIDDLVLGCCDAPVPPPICYGFMGFGGVPCGDPRVGQLFDLGMDLLAVSQAQVPEEVAALLESLLGQIMDIPLGLNVTAEMLYLSFAEINSVMGSQQVPLRDLEWTHRMINAFDLDLRTEGLEVPLAVPAGHNVSVSLGGGIGLTFNHVLTAGEVTPHFRHLFAPPVPSGFHESVPAYHVDLESTVGLPATGSVVTVSMDYSALAFQPGAEVRMFHEEQGIWVDRTLSSDPTQQIVTGQVNGFSNFKLLGVGAVDGITCPPDITLTFPADTSPRSTGYATATGPWPITMTYDDSIVQQPDGGQTITRTWTASDGFSGRLCIQTIQVDADCPADLTGNGTVNASDLALLLGAWGPNTGHPADLNGDGLINASDLALLLGSWGPCQP